MIDEAAEVIAVTLLQSAYAHLPAGRAAKAVELADTGPMARALKAMILEGWREGLAAGERKGRRELEVEMEADWTPVSERIRAQANSPSHAELQTKRAEPANSVPEYTGGPVAPW
jgi:hypothetical protein